MKQKYRLLIAFISLFIMLSYSSVYYVKTENKKRTNIIQNEIVFKSVEDEKYVSPISDLKIKYNNEDIITELVIPSLEIDEVVTKTINNEYYLNYDVYKNYSIYGNPYMDFRIDDTLLDEKQINIYSHNIEEKSLKNKVVFSKLEKLIDKEIFDKTKKMYLLTDEGKIEYDLYAVKLIKNDKEHMLLYANSDVEWQNHLDKLLSNTINCKGECKLQSDAELLVLQTCYFDPKDSYLIVIGKKIK